MSGVKTMDEAEKELAQIFNKNGFDKPAVEYPLQLFINILEWHEERVERVIDRDNERFVHAMRTVSEGIRNGTVEVRTLPLLLDTIAQPFTKPKETNETK